MGLIAKGAFVQFGEQGFEGFLPARRMPDWWTLNELGTALEAEGSGRRLRLGDAVRVHRRPRGDRPRPGRSSAGVSAAGPRVLIRGSSDGRRNSTSVWSMQTALALTAVASALVAAGAWVAAEGSSTGGRARPLGPAAWLACSALPVWAGRGSPPRRQLHADRDESLGGRRLTLAGVLLSRAPGPSGSCSRARGGAAHASLPRGGPGGMAAHRYPHPPARPWRPRRWGAPPGRSRGLEPCSA